MGTFQSPSATAQWSTAAPQTLATVGWPSVICMWGAWSATTQSSGQPCTSQGGLTRAAAKARVSARPFRQPPPESRTRHPGASTISTESQRSGLTLEHLPSTWAQPFRPAFGRLTGVPASSASSMAATMLVPDVFASSTNLLAALARQSPELPSRARLHCQWTFQCKVVSGTVFLPRRLQDQGSGWSVPSSSWMPAMQVPRHVAQ
mmetsp:Transcript_96772/g.282925  ORF Transcript_96772/g.282925 Transcript_96772/m.282925 type:complete len:205 (+) Transcript_96772:438-1052(+)